MTINKYLLTLFCLLMLANIGMLYDLQSGITRDNKPAAANPNIAKDKLGAELDRLIRLESRFEELSAELSLINQALNRLSETSRQNSQGLQDALAYRQNRPEPTQTAQVNQPQVFAGSIEKVFESGVLDEHAWQSMEQDIAAMGKEENKAFWEKMMAKIARDEFIVSDYDN
ncbi:hypothetical protein SG34_001625 [Thalassomonas viridans]|uniref:Uncharacterized protein n=1 Tax=Thalassomonas viridans TaxID=137584 RepID=A0AAF0C9D7_9GAMM|nr:hypothetical protein [Thalassomonas viridans]WDE05668.1 hypothetical protein SG34_001625 [Thalassomonas viridans]